MKILVKEKQHKINEVGTNYTGKVIQVEVTQMLIKGAVHVTQISDIDGKPSTMRYTANEIL